jgi:hypothetical protein
MQINKIIDFVRIDAFGQNILFMVYIAIQIQKYNEQIPFCRSIRDAVLRITAVIDSAKVCHKQSHK